jgi:hypothetical protein
MPLNPKSNTLHIIKWPKSRGIPSNIGIENNLKTSKKWKLQGSWNGTIVLTNKKVTNASNATITKLWLVTLTKVEGSMCTQKPWKERMKDNSKPHHYILSPNPKVAAT